MEGYHFRGIWAASCLFPDRERYLAFVPVGGWVGYSFSFGGVQLVFGVGVCFLQFESQQTEKKVTSRATKDLNLRALALVCNRKLPKKYHRKIPQKRFKT